MTWAIPISVPTAAISTLNIDSIAAQSFKFTDAHALPSCAPTRAALMTGQDQHRVGLGSQNQIYPPGASGDMLGYKGSLEGRSEERRVGKECRARWWADH